MTVPTTTTESYSTDQTESITHLTIIIKQSIKLEAKPDFNFILPSPVENIPLLPHNPFMTTTATTTTTTVQAANNDEDDRHRAQNIITLTTPPRPRLLTSLLLRRVITPTSQTTTKAIGDSEITSEDVTPEDAKVESINSSITPLPPVSITESFLNDGDASTESAIDGKRKRLPTFAAIEELLQRRTGGATTDKDVVSNGSRPVTVGGGGTSEDVGEAIDEGVEANEILLHKRPLKPDSPYRSPTSSPPHSPNSPTSEHPLSSIWTFYLQNRKTVNAAKGNYEAGLQVIGVAKTVEKFARYMHTIPTASGLDVSSRVYVFKVFFCSFSFFFRR